MIGQTIDIAYWNQVLKDKTPDEIIDWALRLTNNNIVTTSFGVYSEVLLSTITKHSNDIKVIWCDTLYNQPSTYEHAKNITEKYHLNLRKYQSLLSKEEIEKTIGFPSLEDDNFDQFSEVVKLEPFKRALKEHNPEVWFTNIRVRQTELRNKKDILSLSKNGILKVSPFYYWTDADLDAYVTKHNLTKNVDYFDPIKALQSRECGIHLQ
jgi:phosphoadenosine phosphosulfate reductase